jgi:hypothetical protein
MRMWEKTVVACSKLDFGSRLDDVRKSRENSLSVAGRHRDTKRVFPACESEAQVCSV